MPVVFAASDVPEVSPGPGAVLASPEDEFAVAVDAVASVLVVESGTCDVASLGGPSEASVDSPGDLKLQPQTRRRQIFPM